MCGPAGSSVGSAGAIARSSRKACPLWPLPGDDARHVSERDSSARASPWMEALGARHVTVVGMPVSRRPLLRRVRAAPVPAAGLVRVLGGDDWARRKGRTYGTILVTLETHEVLDLLPDRTAETLTTWLRGHPEIEIVSLRRPPPTPRARRGGCCRALTPGSRPTNTPTSRAWRGPARWSPSRKPWCKTSARCCVSMMLTACTPGSVGRRPALSLSCAGSPRGCGWIDGSHLPEGMQKLDGALGLALPPDVTR